MSSETLDDQKTITACDGQSDIAAANRFSPPVDSDAAKERLITLARTLGRQATQRHMHRGYSLFEIALCLLLGALTIVALWYGGILHLASGQR